MESAVCAILRLDRPVSRARPQLQQERGPALASSGQRALKWGTRVHGGVGLQLQRGCTAGGRAPLPRKAFP